MDTMPGGFTEPREVHGEIQKICDQVKHKVEEITNKIYVEFIAILYRSQVVAGFNYVIKVHVGGEDYIHLLVFQALPCNGGGLNVCSVQQNKTRDDILEPFVPLPGGYSETEKATKEMQVICDQVKDEVEKQTKKKYVEFIAVVYRSQVVAGVNYLIKVHVGGEDYIHIKVFQALPCNGGGLELSGVQQNKTRDSPLEPF